MGDIVIMSNLKIQIYIANIESKQDLRFNMYI